VRVVGHGDDHGIEFVAMFGEGFAIVLTGEGVGVVLGGFGKIHGVDIAESGDFDIRVAGDLGAVGLSDGPDDADGKDAEFTVSFCSVSEVESKGGEADSGGSGVEKKVSAGVDGAHGGISGAALDSSIGNG